MSGGVGRGRGWLNLTQNPNVPDPAVVGSLPKVSTSPKTKINLNVEDESRFTDSPNDTNDFVNKISQINLSDDGILFNQKLKYITTNWKNCCKSDVETE